MNGTQAIESLDDLMGKMNERYNAMLDESHAIATQWHALKNMGATRDDAAADLLTRVRERIAKLNSFSGRVLTQLDAVIAKPFGE